MENEITVINGEQYSGGQSGIEAKKIKVDDKKFVAITGHRYVEKEEPVIEEPIIEESKLEVEEEPSIEDTIKFEGPVFEDEFDLPTLEKESVVKEETKEEPVMEFAYNASPVEEEIDQSKIDEIKGLGKTYKGTNPNSKLSVADNPEKEKEEISEDDVYELTNRKYYTSKANHYASEQGKKLSQFDGYINVKNNEVSEYQKEYNAVNSKIDDLRKKMDVRKTFMELTNKADLVSFIADNKEYNNLLNNIKTEFDESGLEITSINNSINGLEANKRDLSDKEKAAKDEIMELRRQRKEFMAVAYRNLTKLAELDTEIRKGEEGLTNVTGIMEEENVEPERSAVSSISNLQDMPSMDFSHFDSLREEPQTVASINPYGANQNYNDMTFGGRTM